MKIKLFSIFVPSALAAAMMLCSCNFDSKARECIKKIVEAEQAAGITDRPAGSSRTSNPGSQALRLSYLPEGPDSRNSELIEYEGFTVMFNSDNHTPDWSCWELLGSETEGPESRQGKQFHADPAVSGCPNTSDYTHSGYDRGHLCPAGDMKWSAQSMNDCFTMTNIAPQNHSLNAGAWKTLEDKCRQWAVRDSALVIVAGPIYEPSDRERIGATGVRVPSAFFKVIAAPYLDSPRGIAFIYPNMKSPGNMQSYAMPIDRVEEMLGIDFFAKYPQELQEKIESTADFKLWNRN